MKYIKQNGSNHLHSTIHLLLAVLLFLCSSLTTVSAEGETVVYTPGSTVGAGNAAFTIQSGEKTWTFGVSGGRIRMKEASFSEQGLNVTTDNYLQTETTDGGFQIVYSGQSGKRYLQMNEGGTGVSISETVPSGHWEYTESHLYYVQEGSRYAIVSADENGLHGEEVIAVRSLLLQQEPPAEEETTTEPEAQVQEEQDTALAEGTADASDQKRLEEGNQNTDTDRSAEETGESEPIQTRSLEAVQNQEPDLTADSASVDTGAAVVQSDLQADSDNRSSESETEAQEEFQEAVLNSLQETEESKTTHVGGVHSSSPFDRFLSAVSSLREGGASPAVVGYYTGSGRPERPRPSRQDERVPVFESMTEVPYVLEGSGYGAPSWSVQVKCSETGQADTITLQWYVDGTASGEPVVIPGSGGTSTITVPEFCDRPFGVYPVRCTASVVIGGTTHTSEASASFIVAKGVKNDSVLTFSDVHEKYEFIGDAVGEIMRSNGGYVPSLVIATGDYNNSYVAGYRDDYIRKCLDEMIQRIRIQLGGIDTVWVSGNHDNGYATGFTNANKSADLGMVDEDYYDVANGISGTGIIFDTRSAAYAANAGTSRSANDLIVIGVNYEDLGSLGAYDMTNPQVPVSSLLNYGDETTEGKTVYQYLKTALTRVAENYHGELVVISTHAGLHVLGVDPDSLAVMNASGGDPAWNGGNNYSVTNSAATVKLINQYAEQYDMDILFLFGHDHSHGEKEFIKTPGTSITSSVNTAEQISEVIPLSFTYGHSGYITNQINGSKAYTYLTWDERGYQKVMRVLGASISNELTRAIERRYRIPVDNTPEETSSAGSSSESRTAAGSTWDGVVTCQMAGYTQNYAWNEAVKACQPGWLDDLGVFHPLAQRTSRYYVPDTADAR